MNSESDQRLPFAPAAEPPLLAGLIRHELLEWTKQLEDVFAHLERMRAEGLMPATLSGTEVFNRAAQLTLDMTGKMKLVACLAETYSGHSETEHERFYLSALLEEIIATRVDSRWPHFAIKSHERESAPVYGNKHWLRIMLSHLLRELELNIGPEQKIVFSLRQLGNYVLLTCRDETLPPHDRGRPRPPLPPPTGLTFSLCRRIAELYGGTVRLDSEDEFDKRVLTGFTLSLPTSMEVSSETRRCDDCPLVEQIERYAADLAELLDRCQVLEDERSSHGQTVNRR